MLSDAKEFALKSKIRGEVNKLTDSLIWSGSADATNKFADENVDPAALQSLIRVLAELRGEYVALLERVS